MLIDFSCSAASRSSLRASCLSLMSAAPMKRQMSPMKAARTGTLPFKNVMTYAPHASGPDGKSEKTVNAIKIKPAINETITTP